MAKQKPLLLTDMNLLLYGEMDPDFPRLTAEQKKRMAEMFEQFKPKLQLPSRPIIVGTAGDMNAGSIQELGDIVQHTAWHKGNAAVLTCQPIISFAYKHN